MQRKLIIQIPAYNEKDDIEKVIKQIPNSIDGINDIEIIVVNDGSTDNTLDMVKKAGVEHVVNFDINKGLGEAFKAGISYALKMKADIIVNIDADAQYCEDEIVNIIQPIVNGRASVVIGNRQLKTIKGYPIAKLAAQYIGSWLVEMCFHMRIPDATSGFRAFNRESAILLRDTLCNTYTYTIESLGILSKNDMTVVFVPVNIRYPTRETRLIRNKLYYTANFMSTLLKQYVHNITVSH